jgi:hypothetical protein
MSSLSRMVARKSSEDFVAEDVDGLPVPAVAHRRGQSQRDPDSAARKLSLRSNVDTHGR